MLPVILVAVEFALFILGGLWMACVAILVLLRSPRRGTMEEE